MIFRQLKMTGCHGVPLCTKRAKCGYFARKVPDNPLILLAQSHFAHRAEIMARKVRKVVSNQVLTSRTVTLRATPPFGRVLRCAAQPPAEFQGGWKLIETGRSLGLTNCQTDRCRLASRTTANLDDGFRFGAPSSGCIFDTSQSRFSRGPLRRSAT